MLSGGRVEMGPGGDTRDAATHRRGRHKGGARAAGDQARPQRFGQEGAGGDGLLEGPVSQWLEQLTSFALEYGMDTFIYWPSERPERQVELFAGEVVPAVREAVGAVRER